ncbi:MULTISPECIES: hypothetical protein [unclassified Spirulina]|uniref:hypothetical protein n=1 Tax=unclassified Spirulina TaxID=2684457 RepID=UPI00195132F6|nr:MULTISPECIES: hypothetical protein [Spirulina]MEA5469460.1 hypothetical protein [Spirulina sp. 06S082]
MLTQIQLIPGAISEIFASATETGILTLSDRYGLMAAALDEGLDDEERRAVNRILHFVKQGRIAVTAV